MPATSASHSSAILPLSLLEALRNLDRPVEDGLEELSGEVVAKRLGLNPTVSAEIQRYSLLARRGGLVPWPETEAVFTLIGRRPDANLVLADAGRRAARHAVRLPRVPWQRVAGLAPGPVRRAVGGRLARRLALVVLGAELSLGRLEAEGRLRPSEGSQAGVSCQFYGWALAELLRLLTGFEGAMDHVECRGDGGESCRWRAQAAHLVAEY